MGRNVTFCLKTTVYENEIHAFVLLTDEGIHISVCGGEKSHIGAVSIIAPDGSRSDMQFPGHKDGVITSKWASALHEAGYCPVVACAGIHYDNLSWEGIQTVVSAADQLLSRVLQFLRES